MHYNLLQPKSEEWRIDVVENKDWFEFKFFDESGNYYSYRVHLPDGYNVKDVLSNFAYGMRYDFIPIVFAEEPYFSKIREALGWSPNPFDFHFFRKFFSKTNKGTKIA